LSGYYDDIVVKERITVEGGENNNQTSQFYGPVNFTQKITNTSDNGIETKNLYKPPKTIRFWFKRLIYVLSLRLKIKWGCEKVVSV
jgi:hypothetical protein